MYTIESGYCQSVRFPARRSLSSYNRSKVIAVIVVCVEEWKERRIVVQSAQTSQNNRWRDLRNLSREMLDVEDVFTFIHHQAPLIH